MRPARRLIVAILCLAAFDPFVPGLLRRAEHRRYEETPAFRFANSDLFGLGPFVAYLREHPRSERPRTLFLGNSVIFGFGLAADEAVPARFQERHRETQVFNAAINGFDFGSNALIAAATIDAVDRYYVVRGTPAVHPQLGSLIPVDRYAAAQFGLTRPDPIETRLQHIVDGWRLYASTYRLQAALFGTSTREYIHQHAEPASSRSFSSADQVVVSARPMAAETPGREQFAALRAHDPVLWQFAEMVAAARKRAVVIQFGAASYDAADEAWVKAFNAAFAPFAEIVILTVPPALLFDGRHLTPIGARRLAEALP